MKLLDTLKDVFDFSDDFDEEDDDSYLKDMAKIERKNKERERKSRSSSNSDEKITSIFSKRAENSSTSSGSSRKKTSLQSAKTESESKNMVNAASSTTKNDTGTRNNKYTSSKSTGKNSRSYTNREERTGYNSSRRDSSEISIYNVKNFEDATLVCDKLVSGLPIIVSFDDPNSPNSQRVMDFIAGCIYTLNGSLHTVSDRIFLFSPEGVDVSGDYINMVKENSFGVPTFNKMI